MKVDAICASGLDAIRADATKAEQLGCDGIMAPEVAHDPFLPLTLAATTTERVRLTTGITVAFARNPMSVAVTASDLHRFSGGRFALGLGSQIKAHITRRFSMPWSEPAARMKEFIAAVRAIWDAWEHQTKLDFRGDFYQHTLMTPMFDHGPSPVGWPKIHVAGVGPVMTSTIGEVADGLLAHGFTTPGYVRDVTLPRLQVGIERAGRTRAAVEVTVPAMMAFVDGDDDPRLNASRATIAFYGSTPAYRGVLEHHGWGALGDELHTLSVRGDWKTMATLVDDDVLRTFCAIGSPKEVATEVQARYGGLVDRIQIGVENAEQAAEFLDALRA